MVASVPRDSSSCLRGSLALCVCVKTPLCVCGSRAIDHTCVYPAKRKQAENWKTLTLSIPLSAFSFAEIGQLPGCHQMFLLHKQEFLNSINCHSIALLCYRISKGCYLFDLSVLYIKDIISTPVTRLIKCFLSLKGVTRFMFGTSELALCLGFLRPIIQFFFPLHYLILLS